MQEKLLQFIWQHSLYLPGNLRTAEGELITVVYPGMYNTHAGPDFLQAKVKVGNTLLAGHIELHINSSDWHKHGHQNDAAYNNVILHVVYNNDAVNTLPNIPVLEMNTHIPAEVLTRYEGLMQAPMAIPCGAQLVNVKDITKESWLSRLLAERWEEKLEGWQSLLERSAGDWRNVLYWRMAANFGFKVNADAFLQLALSVPQNVFSRRDNVLQVEAILFGQAGMLESDFKDDYPNQLKTEYAYQRQKYQLQPMPAHLWKFLRMRPANFPTIRIAQFAALIHKSFHLFAQIIETGKVKDLLPLLSVTASAYWDNHYQFDEMAEIRTPKHLGKSSIHNIIINTIAPVQFLYAAAQGTVKEQQQALQLLDAIPAERNNILSLWESNGWKAPNAGHSQALIQLHNNYCIKRRCLDCAVGLSLLRSRPKE